MGRMIQTIKDNIILFSKGGKKNLCFDFKLHKTVFEEDMAVNCWGKRGVWVFMGFTDHCDQALTLTG